MSRDKLFAGHAVRRLRRRHGMTQAAMAELLAISPSYLNLIERNQRAIPAGLLVTLADRFDFDPRVLAAGEPGGGAEAIRRRLADPLFADLEVDRSEVEEWLAAAPGGAEAFARAFDRGAGGGGATAPLPDDPAATVRREIERWRNHFPDLDAAAEALADELRLVGADLYGALVERLRVRHGLAIRILPVEALPGQLRRLDLHARQLQLAERLAPWSRTFALAVQCGLLEARTEIDALARGAALDRVAERLFRRHLASYFAAAVMMPYARFMRACEASGYDLEVLQRRFGAGLEQVAHRLTTLQRVGARGLPFFLLRIDRSGQASKRFTGASNTPLLAGEGRCPLWRIHHAFDRSGSVVPQVLELEDGTRWFTMAAAVTGAAVGAGANRVESAFALALGVPAEVAGGLAAARGLDLTGPATPVGPGCRACHRADCPQRSAPPGGRALLINDRERAVSGWTFAGD
ncbi:helix-turn-helix domain-containing protein [Sphingomonas endophytica]|uniref:Transcriptional regulator n=1 Tax=Sphingomonas endophytica TaxID=869719 RepID=A0A147HWE8_9SPHN|nr:helix-turn-helix transcriptional regulator [Sphingomonas endophytica]KTT69181.1 transcriptional regulator [Sphingomonas endophytica]